MSYLFGFGGRINRAKMWLFIIVTLVWEIAIGLVAVVGLHWTGHLGGANVATDAVNAAGKHFTVFLPWPGHINDPIGLAAVGIIAVLALLYVIALVAVYTKRLHDRNKSAWWLVLFLVIPWGLGVLQCTAIPALLDLGEKFGPLGVGWDVAEAIGTILGLWAFIELFFFRGTAGENRYGPDPLA